jgi:thioredoxin-related protein
MLCAVITVNRVAAGIAIVAAVILLAFLAGADTASEMETWVASVPEAADKARKEEKLLLLDFTGSDWCSWCKKLDAEIFSKPEFIRYASNNLVLVKIDFPEHKFQSDDLRRANALLRFRYGVTGFPTLIIVKPDGAVLWEHRGYAPGGPRAIIDVVSRCRKAVKLAVSANVATGIRGSL